MHVDLFDPSAGDGARPAWQVIEAARRRYLTGLLVLETAPVTHVYLRDGQVYFAERTTDGGLGVRLLVEGVLTRAQMQKATLQVSGVEHLGRMFDLDDTIDRDAVELCVELMTDDVLTSIAEAPVEQWTMKLYQRHPSGLDRWLPTRIEVITHLVESPASADPEATVSPAPRRPASLTPPPVTAEVPATAPSPVASEATTPTIDDTPERPELPPIPVAPAPVAFAAIPAPFGEPVSTEVPIVAAARPPAPAPVPEPQAEPTTELRSEETLAGLAPSAMEALMSGSIKDEVAEAVRRALASIDT